MCRPVSLLFYQWLLLIEPAWIVWLLEKFMKCREVFTTKWKDPLTQNETRLMDWGFWIVHGQRSYVNKAAGERILHLMPIVIWDVRVTIDVETLYPQVICNVSEEMRQRHSCAGNLRDNISTSKNNSVETFWSAEGKPAEPLNEEWGKASWILKRRPRRDMNGGLSRKGEVLEWRSKSNQVTVKALFAFHRVEETWRVGSGEMRILQTRWQKKGNYLPSSAPWLLLWVL